MTAYFDIACDGAPVGGVRVIAVAGQPDRPAARAAIRSALQAALADFCGAPPAQVRVHTAPGRAPHALVGAARVGLSISHDEGLSVAAIRMQGAVGVDVMRIVDAPDSTAVARDYLGPDAARALAALPAPARAAAFARAWSAHEARLKCLGLALAEWNPALAAALATCSVRMLALPPGYAGALALAEAA